MVTGIVPSQKQQRRNSSFHGRKKGIRLVPIQKVPVRIPLQKKIRYSVTEERWQYSSPYRKMCRYASLLLKKSAGTNSFTKKISGTPLQKKGGSTIPLTEKCAATHPFYGKKCRYEFLYKKNMPVLRYRRKVTVLAPLQRKCSSTNSFT